MSLSNDEKTILDLASEDYYSLLEISSWREEARVALLSLLSRGYIELYERWSSGKISVIPATGRLDALALENWNEDPDSPNDIVFTTTDAGDSAYASGEAL